MLKYEQVILHKLIVHKINNKHDQPGLSSYESPITEDDIKFFIRRHIINGQEHRFARTGVFVKPEENTTFCQTLCDDLLRSDDNFIGASRNIATHLFEVVKKNLNIVPGDVVFTTYSIGASGAQHLAILKMEPHEGIVGKPEEMPGGGVRIVLRREADVLPVNDLQKCAFIVPENIRTDRNHLTVLDLQNARRGAMQMVAGFFSKDFLQCQLGLSSAEQTTAFITAALDFKGSKQAAWENEKGQQFVASAMAVLENNRIDVEEFAQSVIESDEEKEEFIQTVRQKMQTDNFGDLIFQPDRTYQTQQQLMVIEGDNELRISVLASEVGVDKAVQIETDAANRHLIKIRTNHLKQKIKHGKKR
jgi:nucleoid-associated protein YejK